MAQGIVIGLVEDAGSQVQDAGSPTTASEDGTGAGTEIAIGTEASIRTKPSRLRRGFYSVPPCPSAFLRRRMRSK